MVLINPYSFNPKSLMREPWQNPRLTGACDSRQETRARSAASTAKLTQINLIVIAAQIWDVIRTDKQPGEPGENVAL